MAVLMSMIFLLILERAKGFEPSTPTLARSILPYATLSGCCHDPMVPINLGKYRYLRSHAISHNRLSRDFVRLQSAYISS